MSTENPIDMMQLDNVIGFISTPHKDKMPNTPKNYNSLLNSNIKNLPTHVLNIEKLAIITAVGCLMNRRQTRNMQNRVHKAD